MGDYIDRIIDIAFPKHTYIIDGFTVKLVMDDDECKEYLSSKGEFSFLDAIKNNNTEGQAMICTRFFDKNDLVAPMYFKGFEDESMNGYMIYIIKDGKNHKEDAYKLLSKIHLKHEEVPQKTIDSQ